MDETIGGLMSPFYKCWMQKGQQKRLPMLTGQRPSQVFAGVLNWRTEQVHCRELDVCHREAIIDFFEWLLTTVYPSETSGLVMANASFHRSAAVQAALSLFEQRVLILGLPPYSPDMNLIERFWKHLKANACANYLYTSIDQLLANIHRGIAWYNLFDHDLHISFSEDF